MVSVDRSPSFHPQDTSSRTTPTIYGRHSLFLWQACCLIFFDGKVARWRKSSSLLGQELDSLADLVRAQLNSQTGFSNFRRFHLEWLLPCWPLPLASGLIWIQWYWLGSYAADWLVWHGSTPLSPLSRKTKQAKPNTLKDCLSLRRWALSPSFLTGQKWAGSKAKKGSLWVPRLCGVLREARGRYTSSASYLHAGLLQWLAKHYVYQRFRTLQ